MLSKRNILLSATVVLATACVGLLAQAADERPDKSSSQPATRGAPCGAVPHGEGGPVHQRRPKPRPMTAQDEAHVLEFLKDHHGEHHARLVHLRETNPDRYRRALRMVGGWVRQLENLPEEVKLHFMCERESRITISRLLLEIRGASGEPKEQLVGELSDAVTKHFAAEQGIREYRLERLEEQIGRLRLELEDRGNRRDQIIQERVQTYIKRAARRRPAADAAVAE